jgi:hypothetical protein
MFKCEHCKAVFRKPKERHIWSKWEENEDFIPICPVCGDDRIAWLGHDNKNKGEESKTNE